MAENQTPSNFITPKSIENLSIAGICVWLICLAASSFNNNIDSFWIRIIAITLSFFWSLSLFIKKKRWNFLSNYIIILVNAVLIYINAAGMNTVTRQSPFEGFGVKCELADIKTKKLQADFFNFPKQIDWYPNYKMIKYIDTLKSYTQSLNEQNQNLKNEFSFIRDKIDEITSDTSASKEIKSFLKDFGNHYLDTLDFPIMKSEYQFKIDSLQSELDFRIKHPITETTYYKVNGTNITAEQYAGQLQKQNERMVDVINLLEAKSKFPQQQLDSLNKTLNF